MFKKLKEIETRFEELESLLADAEAIAKQSAYQKYAKEHSDLSPLVESFREYEKTSALIEDAQNIMRADDDELKELAKEELHLLKKKSESWKKK